MSAHHHPKRRGPSLTLLTAPPLPPPSLSARTASGAEVIVHPQEDRLIVRVAAGLPEIELHLTPAGAVLRTAAPSLTLEAPERLRFAAPRVEIAAKELDVRAERATCQIPTIRIN
ncbi:MAG: hypothetical protein IPK80_05415 [Nannocystis sp.]|nr:hypothetical protein [Nannocystis sp.]